MEGQRQFLVLESPEVPGLICKVGYLEGGEEVLCYL